jgi:hypothetical protein
MCNIERVLSTVPIIPTLVRYRWRRDIITDLVAGVTIAVMHIPQVDLFLFLFYFNIIFWSHLEHGLRYAGRSATRLWLVHRILGVVDIFNIW